MKTKNKTLAAVEIAIVLCSVFLVAIPAIAAQEQNQEMQKVSASEVTTASEDDYVLGVYGNANEDDTIDMRDLTYVKLIFFGKKPETELADAKYDGKINPLDFIQIKLIIVGKEKELTVVDDVNRIVTIDMPLERIVSISGTYGPETFCAFGVGDRLVGVADSAKKTKELETYLKDVPGVGGFITVDAEMILKLKPQIVETYVCTYKYHSELEKALNAAGIKLVAIDFHKPKTYSNAIRTMGYMLNKQERAEELINFEQQHLNLIKERVDDLTDEQKPRVYYETYKDYQTFGSGNAEDVLLIMCGGINIFAELPAGYTIIDSEAVIKRNPQVILKMVSLNMCPIGYDVTNTGPMDELRNGIMKRPGWDHTDAVKNGKVYLISGRTGSTHSCVRNSYIAKWFHPELFEDIDPVEIHREWMEGFLGIEYKGVYAYPTYPV